MNVLIAEDDASSRLLLGERVRRLGHEVTLANDGGEAWDAFERGHYSVVVSDVEMPRMDGVALCRRIRTSGRPHYTYVVLITVRGSKQAYLAGMDAGADDFLTKPYDPDQLAARLRVAERILGLQGRVKQLEGILPICASCKRIRDEEDRWERVEEYITKRTDALFSHGLCPECFAKAVEDLTDR